MSLIKPRNGLVLIRLPKAEESVTDAGIIVPKHAGQQYDIAEIIGVGRGTPDGRGSDTDDLVVGQRVLVTIGQKAPMQGGMIGNGAMQYTGIPLSDDNDIFLINQHDIFGILPEEEPKPLTLTDTTTEMENNQ